MICRASPLFTVSRETMLLKHLYKNLSLWYKEDNSAKGDQPLLLAYIGYDPLPTIVLDEQANSSISLATNRKIMRETKAEHKQSREQSGRLMNVSEQLCHRQSLNRITRVNHFRHLLEDEQVLRNRMNGIALFVIDFESTSCKKSIIHATQIAVKAIDSPGNTTFASKSVIMHIIFLFCVSSSNLSFAIRLYHFTTWSRFRS